MWYFSKIIFPLNLNNSWFLQKDHILNRPPCCHDFCQTSLPKIRLPLWLLLMLSQITLPLHANFPLPVLWCPKSLPSPPTNNLNHTMPYDSMYNSTSHSKSHAILNPPTWGSSPNSGIIPSSSDYAPNSAPSLSSIAPKTSLSFPASSYSPTIFDHASSSAHLAPAPA